MAIRVRDTHLIDDAGVVHHGDVVLTDDGSWHPAGTGDAGYEQIDGCNLVLTRTLQNWHTHLPMTLQRSWAEGLPLMSWLEGYMFPSEQVLTPEHIAAGTWAAAAEMIRTGSSFACDMYFFPDVIAEVMAAAGLRALVTGVVTDFPTPSYPDGPVQALSQLETLITAGAPAPDRIAFGIGTHSVYTCSPENLIRSRDVAARHGAPLHIHVSETHGEIDDCLAIRGATPVHYLESLDFLQPGLVAAHCGWLEPGEAHLLAARHTKAVYCPSSNMKLATGSTMHIPHMTEAEVDVRLGTDGAASNNSLDMRAEAKIASLLQRHDHGDATLMDPVTTWLMATRGSQDWVSWNLDDIRMMPAGAQGSRLLSNLLYSNADCVDMWVAGTAVRRDGVTLTVNERTAIADLEHAAADIQHLSGRPEVPLPT